MRRSGRGTVTVTVLAVLAAGGCVGDREREKPPTPIEFRAGAAGIGDPYFPTHGNGGYDVLGYDLKVRYDPATDQLTGAATITATATEDLARFNFDLSGLTVSSVTVDGSPARYDRDGG